MQIKLKKDYKMTSLNLDAALYKNFKKQSLEDNMTLIKLVTNAMNTYLSQSIVEKNTVCKDILDKM